MIARTCPRCHTQLELEDEAALAFCFHCGAPQVLLGQELRELAEAQLAPASGGQDAPAAARAALPPQDLTTMQWQPMLRIVLAVSAGFAIFVLRFAPLALVVPALVLALYTSRYRVTRITTALGARVGLLCGLTMVTLASAMAAASALFLRLRTQEMAGFDAALAAQFQIFRDRLTAQNVPDVATTTAFLNIPEFRSGMVLGGFAMAAAFFLVLVTLSGALAGFARSRGASRARA